MINSCNPTKSEMIDPATCKRIRKAVIIIHLAIVGMPFLVVTVYQWFKPKPPERIQVKLVQLPPAGNIKKNASRPVPEPKRKKKKVMPEPKKQVVSKPRPKKRVVKKSNPRRKILKAEDIKISRNIVKPRVQPHRKLSSDILEKKILKDWEKVKSPVKVSPKSSGQVIAAYSNTVGAYLKPIWNQPDKISLGGRTPEVTIKITVAGNGRVLNSRIIRKSGVPIMDNSVFNLLKKLRHVPPPPDNQTRSISIILAIEP